MVQRPRDPLRPPQAPPPPPPPPPPAGGGEPPEEPPGRRGRPSGRFPSEPPALRRLIALWPVLTALATGAAGTWGWMEAALDSRIQAAVKAHDDGGHDATPHPAIDARVAELEAHEEAHLRDYVALRTRMGGCEQSLREAYWWLVGDKAAERERDRRRAALAAREARERFLRYVREGQSLDEAYRHALPPASLPW